MKNKVMSLTLGLGLASLALGFVSASAQNYSWATIAGMHVTGSSDGAGSAARFGVPQGIAVDHAGRVFVVDTSNSAIRQMTPQITPMGTNWEVATIAGLAGVTGTNDGPGNAARFNLPQAVAVDGAGNVYVADSANYTIRRLVPAGTNWWVATIAGQGGVSGNSDGLGSAARFGFPIGLAADPAGNLYVLDNGMVRRLTPAGTNWMVSTLTGQSIPYRPVAIAVDSATNLYVMGQYGAIAMLPPLGTYWVAGSLTNTSGGALAVDNSGHVFLASGLAVDELTLTGTNWSSTPIAGSPSASGTADGTNQAVRFMGLQAITADPAGSLYVADANQTGLAPASTIRRLTPVGANWVVTTLAGAGSFLAELVRRRHQQRRHLPGSQGHCQGPRGQPLRGR